MAERPVFMSYEKPPYVRVIPVEFRYNSGFAIVQKQKNIMAIHDVFHRVYPSVRVLEISSKSMQPGGKELSAFHLLKYVPSLKQNVPVENAFQAGKVFTMGGPYLDLLKKSPKKAKRDERLRTSGKLLKFVFESQNFPLVPTTIFYDFLYMNALLENTEISGILDQYDAFTDIEFNPAKSINCQARAAAAYVALRRLGRTESIRNFSSFYSLMTDKNLQVVNPMTPVKKAKKESIKLPAEPYVLHVHDEVVHGIWGHGEVIKRQDNRVDICFPTVGQKTLALPWVMEHCKIIYKD